MTEVSSELANKPVVVVTNKGLIDREDFSYSELESALLERGPEDWHSVVHAFRPGEVPEKAGDSEFLNELEENSIEPESIDESVKDFVTKTADYFTEIAIREGYIKEGTKIDFRTIFVSAEKFREIVKKRDPGVSPFYKGSINSVYLPYHEKGSDMRLFFFHTIFHEFRHRVGRHFLNFKLVDNGDDEEVSWVLKESHGMGAMAVTQDEKRSLMEEVFTVGYETEHSWDIANDEFQKLQAEHLALMIEKDINLAYEAVWGLGGVDPEGYNAYKPYAAIYHMLKLRVPGFLETCIDVRAGRPGSRNKLARGVLDGFGREGLAAVVYADDNHGNELAQVLYACAMERQGKIADPKHSNIYVIKKNLLEIIKGLDNVGAIAKSLNLNSFDPKTEL